MKKRKRSRIKIKADDGTTLVLENCGNQCGVFDGYLCPGCSGLGRVVSVQRDGDGGDAA